MSDSMAGTFEQKEKDLQMEDTGGESDDNMDDEQLEEYKEMVEGLGTRAEKVKINTLSMVAEDYADSSRNAAAIYSIIREPLISTVVHSDRKLPLVYLLDSILYNVKGQFVPLVEKDAANWLPVVYQVLPQENRAKLEKIWNLWSSRKIFAQEKLEDIGSCFSSSGLSANSELEKAGLSIGKNGRLTLVPALRDAMQKILDEMQQDEDEMEKVSLERLAAINVNLLIQIKDMAETSLRSESGRNKDASVGGGTGASTLSASKATDEVLSFLVETRSPEILNRSKQWEKSNLVKNTKEARDVIASLHRLVRESANIDKRYTQLEAIEMTGVLAAVSVTAALLRDTLQQIKHESENKKAKSKMSSSGYSSLSGMPGTLAPSYFKIDRSIFTNDGIKILNEAIIGLLYEVGLPFISNDGRRFATQLEVTKHMDALFKRKQIEKSITATQERGWYLDDDMWSKGGKSQAASTNADNVDGSGKMAGDDDDDPESFTMPADESRDRCVICGINFKMVFDNDDGIYKYNNCREIEVLNDEAAARESEEMFVHVTCWRNLGSPDIVTADQTLQDSRISY
mmetsp:Transcript_26110/g.71612  ORF Transcript_26110/g.71612 Transcript_26110/m.71612 type:complete len:571 (+) Transcript_26110:306-2018(+)